MPCFSSRPNQFRTASADSPVSWLSESICLSLGNTLNLLNHVAQTSAASSERPTSTALDAGVVCVSSGQLGDVTEEGSDEKRVKSAMGSWRLDWGKSCTSSCNGRLPRAVAGCWNNASNDCAGVGGNEFRV